MNRISVYFPLSNMGFRVQDYKTISKLNSAEPEIILQINICSFYKSFFPAKQNQAWNLFCYWILKYQQSGALLMFISWQIPSLAGLSMENFSYVRDICVKQDKTFTWLIYSL